MCEVLWSTFEDTFPHIKDAIQKSSFLAIDSEFTGLRIAELEDSYFDTAEERYVKMSTNASKFINCQIGLSAFIKDFKENRYTVRSYNFYLYPHSCGVVDNRFLIQASSLEFLSLHSFDFNKFVYEGIPFLNEEKCRLLKDAIRRKDYFSLLQGAKDERDFNRHCSDISEWLQKAVDGDVTHIDIPECNAAHKMVMHLIIRSMFSNAWSKEAPDGKVAIQKVSEERRLDLENGDNLEQRYVNSMIGFTRVFRCIADSKKPLVGHNLLTDLMLMYNQFYNPLPKTLKEFKQSLVGLFPCIFDTKYLTRQFERMYRDDQLFDSSVLGDLYKKLSSSKGILAVLYSPEIKHAEGCEKYVSKNCYHEAAYDAFLSGYVYLRMGHIHAIRTIRPGNAQPLRFGEVLHSLQPYRNKVHVMKSSFMFLNMDGQDPGSKFPDQLVVESRNGQKIDAREISQILVSYGTAEVKAMNNSQVLVVMTSRRGMEDAGVAFQKHREYRAVRYSLLKHSSRVRTALWFGAATSLGISITLGYYIIKHR